MTRPESVIVEERYGEEQEFAQSREQMMLPLRESPLSRNSSGEQTATILSPQTQGACVLVCWQSCSRSNCLRRGR